MDSSIRFGSGGAMQLTAMKVNAKMSEKEVHMKKNFLKICALMACSLALSACDNSGSAPVQEGTSPVQPAPTTPAPVPTPSPAPAPEDEGKRGTIPATGGELKHQNVTVVAVEGFTSGEVDVTIKKEPITAEDTAKLGEGVRLIDKFSIKSNNDTNAQLIVNLDTADKAGSGEVTFITRVIEGLAPEIVGIIDEGEEYIFETSSGSRLQNTTGEQINHEIEISTSGSSYQYSATYRIYVILKSRLVNDTNGAWNGHFVECKSGYAFNTDEFKCVLIEDSLRGSQGANEITLLSLNAGNASPSCATYKSKLCFSDTEARIRNEMINKYNPDIILFQELWNGQCNEVLGIDFEKFSIKIGIINSICNKKSRKSSLEDQIGRLLGYNILDKEESPYVYKCASLEQGAYECIAINKNKLEFTYDSAAIRSVAQNIAKIEADKKGRYCSDAYKNPNNRIDTGFFAASVKFVDENNFTPIFDIWNAHLATPFPSGAKNHTCRAEQLATLTLASKKFQTRMLVGGDFNTSYNLDKPFNELRNDESHMRIVYGPYKPLPDVVLPKNKEFYLLSNPQEKTAGFGSVGYDHIASNFAEGKCERLPWTEGLDHRSTFCRLTGFETGLVSASYQALDSSGSNSFDILPSRFVGSYRGVMLRYLSTNFQNKAVAYVPAGIPVELTLYTECVAAPEIKHHVNVMPYQTLDLRLQRRVVYKTYCPQ